MTEQQILAAAERIAHMHIIAYYREEYEEVRNTVADVLREEAARELVDAPDAEEKGKDERQ